MRCGGWGEGLGDRGVGVCRIKLDKREVGYFSLLIIGDGCEVESPS